MSVVRQQCTAKIPDAVVGFIAHHIGLCVLISGDIGVAAYTDADSALQSSVTVRCSNTTPRVLC